MATRRRKLVDNTTAVGGYLSANWVNPNACWRTSTSGPLCPGLLARILH